MPRLKVNTDCILASSSLRLNQSRYANPTDPDFWSWFAGFWEGEGSACIPSRYRQGERGYQRARITVAQKTRVPLDYIVQQTQLGKISFRPPKRIKQISWNDEGTFLWNVDKRRDVIYVAEMLRPHVRFRHELLDKFICESKAMDANAGWIGWTDNEQCLLKEMYRSASTFELIQTLNRDWPSIRQKANRLGLYRKRGAHA